jgi:hypothetical protein
VIVRLPPSSALGSTPSLALVPVSVAVVSPKVTVWRTGTPTGCVKIFADAHAYPAAAGTGDATPAGDASPADDPAPADAADPTTGDADCAQPETSNADIDDAAMNKIPRPDSMLARRAAAAVGCTRPKLRPQPGDLGEIGQLKGQPFRHVVGPHDVGRSFTQFAPSSRRHGQRLIERIGLLLDVERI